MRRFEVIALAAVLTAAAHAMPLWILDFLPKRDLYERIGEHGLLNILDALSLVLPLVLTLATPRRSGLVIGQWRGHWAWVLGICGVPIVATAVVYPFTSQPFAGAPIGIWLLSPAAQELLFAGYLYGLISAVYPGALRAGRMRIRHAALLTALFFALWHLPNFAGIQPGYVVFQLAYTFVGGLWVLMARQLTGSVLPGIATHMAVNAIAWAGW